MKKGWRYAWIFVGMMHLATISNAQKLQKKSIKVILFMDTECPVTQSYIPELRNMHAEYSAKGIEFESVFPVRTVNQKDINHFLTLYKIPFTGTPDVSHQKVNRYHATVMPEAVLLDKNGMVVYQGAIDNWYFGLGKNRPKATEHYLRNAIDATLTGNPVLRRKTEAIGCLIDIK